MTRTPNHPLTDTPPAPPTQPPAAELRALQQLCQAGQWPLAQARAQALLARYPSAIPVLNLLALCQQAQGQLAQAAATTGAILALAPGVAELHCNLATLLTQLGDTDAAIASYRRALQLKPGLTVAHFNLGALLQQGRHWRQAAAHYRQAVAQQPGFFQAWANLGAVLQGDGDLQAAEGCYRQALALNADGQGHHNLGTVLYAQGRHPEAKAAFAEAVRIQPGLADAWVSLGETCRDLGDMEAALRHYRQALAVMPAHPRAQYNLGESYALAGRLDEAMACFSATRFADAGARLLQCLYKQGQFEPFKRQLAGLAAQPRHDSVLVAALSCHYALNTGQPDPYRFCPEPERCVLHTRLDELAAPDSPLLGQLLADIGHLAIAERKQGRLYYGVQSAGNLLQRPEASFQRLAALLRAKISAYPAHFAHSDGDLIRLFPSRVSFASSWYLRMRQGGHLTAHIHEEGWISGCVYLKLPDKGAGHEGSFAYGRDGDGYPRLHDGFASHIVDLAVGDLVLFPSSLFHRTLPFHGRQERVCVAFDVAPGP